MRALGRLAGAAGPAAWSGRLALPLLTDLLVLVLVNVLVVVVRVVVVPLNSPDRWSSSILETVVVTREVISMLKCVLVESLVPPHVSEVTRKDIAKLTL